MSDHTPVSWEPLPETEEVFTDNPGRVVPVRECGKFWSVAYVVVNYHRDRNQASNIAAANARIIAAAPDMVEVCLELRRLMLVIESSVRNISPEHSEAINTLLHRNNAAIAKGLPT